MKTNTTQDPIYNLSFGLLCLSSLFFSTSFNMIIPELPEYLRQMGGEEYIGMIIGLFTLTAGISRPFSGKLTDTIGRKPVMIFGAFVCILCGLVYPLVSSVFGFLFLRLVHGFSTGFTPTAIAAYVADLTPQNRLGEAMGINGVFFGSGMAIGPAIGSTIKLYYSYDVLFLASTAVAMLSALLIFKMKETLKNKQTFHWKLLKIKRDEIVEPLVLAPGIITFLSYSSLGMAITLIPDWTIHLGVSNKGLFFIVYTIFSLLVRFIGGKTSDRYGRKPVAMIGFILLFIGLVLMATLQSTTGLIMGSAVYGMAIGILWPAISAWTFDLGHPQYRGRAMATTFIALEAGIGCGAFLSGWYYAGQIDKIPFAMLTSAVLALIGFLYLYFHKNDASKSVSHS